MESVDVGIPGIAAEREIITTRVMHAPIAAVYKAWAHPDHLKEWWGPEGFTNTFEVFDFRPGGTWKFVMLGPEQGHYQNECVFTEINPPHLIAWQRISKPLFGISAHFAELDAQSTRLTFRMIFDTAEECEKLRKYVPEKNEENLDRLEVELKRVVL